MTTNTEARIAKMARKMAKMICEMRRAGEREAAARLEALAVDTAEQMRAGRL